MTHLTTQETQFYPTPPELAEKMLAGIEWDMVENVLEPSAGKGDLAKAVVKARFAQTGRWRGRTVTIDCIEIDPYLQQILKYNFSAEASREIRDRYHELDQDYRNRTDNSEHSRLKQLIEETESASVHLIHDDFLTYAGYKRYQLCIMNPPFADGDMHLLKALDVMRHGGTIVCLLNAETLRNPYSDRRKLLMRELDKREAKISYITDAFVRAERRTDVDIALVRVEIPHAKEDSDIWQRMKKAMGVAQPEVGEVTDVAPADRIEHSITMYQVEVAAGMELIRQYIALAPYISHNEKYKTDCILTLKVAGDKYNDYPDVNRYLRETRLKYWRDLLEEPEFTGKLTSNLREKWRGMVESMADYDFTRFNVMAVFREMNAEMATGLKDNIMALFEKLTVDHSYYPECKVNRHYYDGWKTNTAHKIGKKVIIPTWGIFSDSSWRKKAFDDSKAYAVLGDIEKTLNYLDGGMTREVDLSIVLDSAASGGQVRNIQCKYFAVDLYKKGTTHIKFHPQCMDLVEKLNIYAAQNRAWLPPNYGKTRYEDMAVEEQAVVDSFQGKAAYSRVMAMAGYFLQGVQVAGLLGGGRETRRDFRTGGGLEPLMIEGGVNDDTD